MDIAPFVRYHRKRLQRLEEKRHRARQDALQALDRMIPIFKATPGLKRVYLFGSLHRAHFREDSDIDLAIEGVSPQSYLNLSVQLQKMADRPVDLVDLADCDQKFGDFIRKFGRLIYEQSS